jgi:hypothetical protein
MTNELNQEQMVAYAKEMVKRECNAVIQRSQNPVQAQVALAVVARLIDAFDLVEYK